MDKKVEKPHGWRRDRWIVRLVMAQLTLSGRSLAAVPSAAEDRWPARLIHGGTLLAGASGLVFITWLRRRL